MLRQKVVPPWPLPLQLSLTLATCDRFAVSPLRTLPNASTACSSPWHLLSNSVCPSVVCLSGIAEHPFLCVYIFSPFFSAILQTSLLFDFPISLSLRGHAGRDSGTAKQHRVLLL